MSQDTTSIFQNTGLAVTHLTVETLCPREKGQNSCGSAFIILFGDGNDFRYMDLVNDICL